MVIKANKEFKFLTHTILFNGGDICKQLKHKFKENENAAMT